MEMMIVDLERNKNLLVIPISKPLIIKFSSQLLLLIEGDA